MKEISDTDRLEWVLAHGHEFDYSLKDHKVSQWWVKWYSESKHYIAYGKDVRDCIDNAIRGEFSSF